MSRAAFVPQSVIDASGADSPLRKLRKTRAPSRQLERAEQIRLFQWRATAVLQLPELDALVHIPNAGGYTGGFKKNRGRVLRMLEEGVRPGVSDIVLPVRRGKLGSLWIELKSPEAGEKGATSRQLEWIVLMERRGNRAMVCVGWESARDAIVEYLAIKD